MLVGIGSQFPNGIQNTGELSGGAGNMNLANFTNFRPQYTVPGQSTIPLDGQSLQENKN